MREEFRGVIEVKRETALMKPSASFNRVRTTRGRFRAFSDITR